MRRLARLAVDAARRRARRRWPLRAADDHRRACRRVLRARRRARDRRAGRDRVHERQRGRSLLPGDRRGEPGRRAARRRSPPIGRPSCSTAARARRSIRSGSTAASCAPRSTSARRSRASTRCARCAARCVQAIAAARGPQPGPVQLEVPLRKPLEPAAPCHRCRARARRDRARAARRDPRARRRRSSPIRVALAALAARIADEPRGVIVAGALPARRSRASRDARSSSRAAPAIRCSPRRRASCASRARDGVAAIDHFDLVLAGRARARAGARRSSSAPSRSPPRGKARSPRPSAGSLADAEWLDPDARARARDRRRRRGDRSRRSRAASRATDRAFASARGSPPNGALRPRSSTRPRSASAQRSATRCAPRSARRRPARSSARQQRCRSASSITRAPAAATVAPRRSRSAARRHRRARRVGDRRDVRRRPVVLVLGDVSFAHDLGAPARRAAGTRAARDRRHRQRRRPDLRRPARREARAARGFERHWLAAPGIDPSPSRAALGVRATRAETPSVRRRRHRARPPAPSSSRAGRRPCARRSPRRAPTLTGARDASTQLAIGTTSRREQRMNWQTHQGYEDIRYETCDGIAKITI